MSPKIKFNKETIVEAALDIAKENGLSGITARQVAKKLQSSVAPIYVNFSTIEELTTAVVERVFAISEDMLAKQKGDSVFDRIGKASLKFAKKYPVLFRELSIQPNPYMQSYESIEHKMIQALKNDEGMKEWTVDERKRVLLKMRIFQMGLSVMVANNHIPTWLDDNEIEDLLMETGRDVLIAEELKHK